MTSEPQQAIVSAGAAGHSDRIARNAVAIAASSLLARGIQFGWAILLAQLLGDAGYGTWGTISAMMSIAATLPEFGIGLIVLRDVARDRSLAGRYLATTMLLQPTLGAIAYVLVILAGLLLPYDTSTRALLVLAGISLIVDTLGNMSYNQMLAVEQMVVTSAILVIHVIVLIAFAFAALTSGGGLAGLYVATIAAGLFRVALYGVAMRRTGIRPQWPFDRRLARYLLISGLPLALGAFFTYAYQQIDKVLVYSTLGNRDAGNLVAAFVIVFGVVELANSTILTALFPMMSRMAQDAPDSVRGASDRLAHLTLVLTLPMGVAISALAAPLARLFFPGFVNSSVVLEVLIWHAIVTMVGNAYGQMMLVEGRQGPLLLMRLAALVTNIALNLLLLPVLRVQGAGVAILISQLLLLALFLWAREPSAAILRRLAWNATRVCVAGGAMYGLLLILRPVNPILAGGVGMLAYGALLIALRALSPADWALIRRATAGIPVLGRIIVALIPQPH